MRARLITKFGSISEWKDYCLNTHSLYLKNKHFRKWINEKEICIFNFSNLRKEHIKHIKFGIEDAVKLGALHFNVHCCNGAKIGKIIGINNKKIDGSKLLKMIIKERKKHRKEHADILIVNNPVKSSNIVIRDGEALTYVSEGVMIFTFGASQRYPSDFLRRRAKHEALHMLGLNVHHEDTKVIGYKYGDSCVMEYNAPTINACKKCRDALKSFWKGVEYATQNQFVKN